MLTMKKADYEKILAHAKENLPEEACGLIAGTKDGDKKIIEKVTRSSFCSGENGFVPKISITAGPP